MPSSEMMYCKWDMPLINFVPVVAVVIKDFVNNLIRRDIWQERQLSWPEGRYGQSDREEAGT
jgi:hypothetical protein